MFIATALQNWNQASAAMGNVEASNVLNSIRASDLFRSTGLDFHEFENQVCFICEVQIRANVLPLLNTFLITDLAEIVVEYSLVVDSGAHYCGKYCNLSTVFSNK